LTSPTTAPGATQHKAAASTQSTAAKDPWAAITVKSVILCRDPEPGPERSWWEAVVTEVSKDNKSVTVRWRDFPTQKPFTVKRTAVAILPPKA